MDINNEIYSYTYWLNYPENRIYKLLRSSIGTYFRPLSILLVRFKRTFYYQCVEGILEVCGEFVCKTALLRFYMQWQLPHLIFPLIS